MKKFIEFIAGLVASKYWGTLEIKFQEGKIVHVFKKESIQGEIFNE
jgi:hypothetical protein